MTRLIEAGEWKPAADWSPSASLARPGRTDQLAEQRHLRQRFAERRAWVDAHGLIGWQREIDRRRAVRVARMRRERLEREARSGPPRWKGTPRVPSIAAMLTPAQRAQLVDRLTELAEIDLTREPEGVRPPDPPAELTDPAAGTAA